MYTHACVHFEAGNSLGEIALDMQKPRASSRKNGMLIFNVV
jgi:hypothetical protein